MPLLAFVQVEHTGTSPAVQRAVKPRRLSDLEIVGCKSAAVVHFFPSFCPIAGRKSKKTAKTALAEADCGETFGFRYRRSKSDSLAETADRFASLASRMKSTVDGFDGVRLMGVSAMHPPAPRSVRHAGLLLLAGNTGSSRAPACRRQDFFALSNSTQVLLEPQRSALPGTPIAAPAGASNRFQAEKRPPPSSRSA